MSVLIYPLCSDPLCKTDSLIEICALENTHHTCFWLIYSLIHSFVHLFIHSNKNLGYLLCGKHCAPIKNQIVSILTLRRVYIWAKEDEEQK